ncbi:uncharacterized protein LOC117173722 [Belonocnema kinseyi]|uniref:uncharacterized protein LOC117173722 n=1 Tax=Belonocnema kinseyi TaxID=2817044 RepID=UPI00143CD6ED|nr:uncharacterized protein LOC117173722 [Belonocnema kinseyi]
MNRKFPDKSFLSLLLLFLINGNVLADQRIRDSEIPKGCSQLKCKKEEQCISRRFWCKSPPCPQMLYCAKSRKESLKGPSTCSSVRCSMGYVCLVKVRNCTWDENCKQKIARCVSEREYYEGPASCADFQCPQEHRCILRESLCARPPCKVLKSCARSSDAVAWFTKCKELGCLSEYECFLRRPINNCTNAPCKHSPDCTLPPEKDSNENCRGWVCPNNQVCLAQVLEPCKLNFCQVSRTCKEPSYGQNIATERFNTELKTLNDLEKDWFYQQAEKRRLQAILLTTISPIINQKSMFQNAGYDISRQLFFKPGELATSAQGHNLELLNSARRMPHVPSVPVYKYPTYLASTVQPRQIFTPDKTHVKSVTTTSVPSWFESLKSRTGIDVISFWVKQAEENQHYVTFQQWLESIRETLDPEMYRLWLEEVRLATYYSKKFQDWLPLPVTNQNLNIQQFYDFEPKINDMEREVPSAFPRSEIDEQSYEIGEYKEEISILTTPRIVNKLAGDVTKYVESATANVSQNFEMEKSSVVPTFIIIQPPRTYPDIFDTQQLLQLVHYYFSVHQPPEFRVPGHPIRSSIDQVPIYPYLLQNNFPSRPSAFTGIHWQNFVNAYPQHFPFMPEINRYLNSFNYLNQYLKPFSRWNNADFGYTHFDQDYPAIWNDQPDGIYSRKGVFDILDSNPESRKVNWRDYFEKSNFYKGGDKDLRSKIDRFGKPVRKLETNPEFLNEKEKEEQEIQFLLQILQEIIDYDFDGKGRGKKENENKNDNTNEVLLESLIHMLEEELDESQENIENPKLDNFVEKIKKERENDLEISEDQPKKFFDHFSGPLLRRSKSDDIFRSPNISQDSSFSSKTSTLVDNINSFIEKYAEVLSRKDYEKSNQNLSNFFNPKEQNSNLNISLQEVPKKEDNSPEIIFPKAGYYDFIKNEDLAKSGTHDKNPTIFDNEEIKQTDTKDRVKNLSKNVKKSNDESEDE